MQAGSSNARRRFGRPFTGPGDQSATFIELFFDLVFVFAITEVTALSVEHLDPEGIARSTLVLWMIWWAWTQWTWTLNPADTEHGVVRMVTLAAAVPAFMMAASVGDAFGEDGGRWFAIAYVTVKAGGLLLYAVVASEHDQQFAAVRRFALASVAGMVAVVIGGFADADVRHWWWLAAVLLDIGAALVGGRAEGWDIHAGHFTERHGLFVIIALGESLIVVGLTLADAEPSADLLGVVIGAVVVTCLLWWSYFGWLKDALEAAFERTPPASGGSFARDVYSLLHFPLIGGVIGVAVAFEEMAHHPAEHLEPDGTASLAIGLTLFVGAGALAWWRAGGRPLLPRITLVAVLAAAVVATSESHPTVVLAVVAAILAMIAGVELWRDPTDRAPRLEVAPPG